MSTFDPHDPATWSPAPPDPGHAFPCYSDGSRSRPRPTVTYCGETLTDTRVFRRGVRVDGDPHPFRQTEVA